MESWSPLKKTLVITVAILTGAGIFYLPSQSDYATPYKSSQSSQSSQSEPTQNNLAPASDTQTTPVDIPSNSNESSTLSNSNYYTNSDGNTVHSPAYSEDGSIPAGATAQCYDGTYSFSQHRQGTCSHHGGVATWY